MRYLVDSDRVVSGLKGVPAALDLLDRLSDQGLAVSVVTLAEVFERAYGTPDPSAYINSVRQFLSGYTVLEVNDPVVEVFARIRALLRKQGNLIADLDLLIAATALAFNLTLVTGNTRHFARVPGLRLHRPD